MIIPSLSDFVHSSLFLSQHNLCSLFKLTHPPENIVKYLKIIRIYKIIISYNVIAFNDLESWPVRCWLEDTHHLSMKPDIISDDKWLQLGKLKL